MLIKKSIRGNIHKKEIINNIFFKLGLPNNYIAKIVNDIFTTLISNIFINKTNKIMLLHLNKFYFNKNKEEFIILI